MSRFAQRDAALRPARTTPAVVRKMPASMPKLVPWPSPPDWMETAACARPEVDPEWFDAQPAPNSGDSPNDVAVRALAVCAVCPVVAECRELGDSLPRASRARLVSGGTVYGIVQRSVEPYDLCAGDCNNLIRPTGTLRPDYPDTIAHRANGLCYRCHKARPQ